MMRRVEVIGHRGARGLFPENTIEGFRRCLDLGVRSFELDVGMTADGVVVVSHDPALNPAITRDAAGQWLSGPGPLIHDLTFDALRSYDVGRIRPVSEYRMRHRMQKGQDGARIPTLRDVLLLSADATFIVELKTDPRYPGTTAEPAALAEAVLMVVDAAAPAARVILESFDWRGPRHIRRVRPDRHAPDNVATRRGCHTFVGREFRSEPRRGPNVVLAQGVHDAAVLSLLPTWRGIRLNAIIFFIVTDPN